MKRKPRRLSLQKESLFRLDLVAGGSPPSEFGSECPACITRTIVVSGIPCLTNPCPSGAASACNSSPCLSQPC